MRWNDELSNGNLNMVRYIRCTKNEKKWIVRMLWMRWSNNLPVHNSPWIYVLFWWWNEWSWIHAWNEVLKIHILALLKVKFLGDLSFVTIMRYKDKPCAMMKRKEICKCAWYWPKHQSLWINGQRFIIMVIHFGFLTMPGGFISHCGLCCWP